MDTTKIAILIILGIIALWLVSKATKIFSKNSSTTTTTVATTSGDQPWDWSWLKFVGKSIAILGGFAIATFIVHWCWCYMTTESNTTSIILVKKVELSEIHVAPGVWSYPPYRLPDKDIAFDVPYPTIIRLDGDDRRTFVAYPNRNIDIPGITRTMEFMGVGENQYSFYVRETDHH